MNAAPQNLTPSQASILRNARDLLPDLRAQSAAINAARQIPDDVMALLRDAGLMQLARPRAFGGPQVEMRLIFMVAQVLAEGDGSTAWVYGVTNSHDHLIGLYPREVQEAYWHSPQPLSASSYQPQGRAERVDGGYRLTGRWSFCSGIDHSSWLVVGCLAPPPGASAPSLLLFLLRKDEVVVDDDWYMMGLAGTGSKSVVVDDLFVPDARVLDNAAVVEGRTPGAAIHEDPLYHTSIWPLFGFSILAPATGIVRGAYETMIAEVRKRVSGGDPTFAARQTPAQLRLAEVGALLESSELLFRASLTETSALIASGRPLSTELRVRNRRNQAFIARNCREAVDILMQLAGGRGLKENAPIQRAMRDLYAISAHPGGNWDAAMSSFGSVLLGGPPTEMFC